MDASKSARKCTVVLHDDAVSKEDVLCGSNILEIGQAGYLSGAKTKILSIHAQAVAKNPDEVSVHISVARLFGFENRMKAKIDPIEDIQDATATHVEILFRDQHLSRADMWRMKGQLESSVLYQGQNLKYLGSTTASIEAVYVAGKEVDSAYIQNPRTKLIFRSGSARFTILIQVSKEMLEYWRDGDLMYERLISGFLPDLFHRWDKAKVRHSLTIVLFGRRLPFRSIEDQTNEEDAKPEDFFRVVAANVPSGDWRRVLRKLKRLFNSITRSQQVSLAADGNMLQAINLAAMDFANSYIDHPLSSTGTSITAITAGSGLFEAEHELLRRTTTTLMGNSVGVDIVSLSPKPLHPVPLFQYKRNDIWEYALPHWADVSYWHPREEGSDSAWLLPPALDDVNGIAIAPLNLNTANGKKSFVESLDAFDDGVFASTEHRKQSGDSFNFKKTRHQSRTTDSLTNGVAATAPNSESPETSDNKNLSPVESKAAQSIPNPNSPPKSKKEAAPPHPLMQSTSRKISLGPRGLAIGQATASTTVSTQYAQHAKENATPGSPAPSNETTSILAKQIRESLRRKPSQRSLASHAPTEAVSISNPIDIKSEEQTKSEASPDPASMIERAVLDQPVQAGRDSGSSLSATPRAAIDDIFSKGAGDQHDAVSPWLTLLNPCNPRRDNMRVASQYRQWQNVFPRAVKSSAFKWDSITTPAILPLMIESRVSLTSLERHFDKKVRRLVATQSGARDSMLRMVALRLISGFQIVPIRKLPYAKLPSDQIERMLLSLGDRYHELRSLSDVELQVSEYDPETSDAVDDTSIEYPASVKPFAARKERPQVININECNGIEDWSSLDDQAVNRAISEDAGRIQARFVLIPVDFSRDESHQRTQSRELNDQERRLDGIQRLTQLWQRNRYFADQDERHKSSMDKPKTSSTVDRDPNPLAIEYQTRDPSAVVTALGGNLDGHLANGDAGLLFADSEKYHSSNFDMVKLVKQMQESPPIGVELRDRRWLTRLHLKCFRGDEMTNWLLGVFKDLDTREDTVALGNQLMSKDIFTHVRGRHEFRDGNYFYQIKSAHRTMDYPDTAGFFTKGIGRSVPSTPIAEHKHSPINRPTPSDSDSSSKGTGTPALAPVDSQKKEVLLSQVLQYNVDSSKKSDHLEVVNLHYDRIHNPDNCYHIQIDWTSTTIKLIRDSVTRWTSLVESHGLKLVQLPLSEASKVHEHHPFDQVISVKLAARPPDKVLATPQLDPNTFSPRLAEDPNGYHKALLRKMDFVLDLEAASSFPKRLDVRYSWGRPSYELTQFIHKSGLLLAQISNDGRSDFLILQNRLAFQTTTAAATKKAESSSLESLVQNFVTFCRNEGSVRAFFEEVKKPKVAAPSPFSHAAMATDNDVPPMELPPHLLNRGQKHGGLQ